MRIFQRRDDVRYHRRELLDDPLLVALCQHHALASRASIDLRALARERWIIGAARGPCREAGLAACAAAGFNPDVAQRVNDWAALLRLTAADCGVALIPRLAINTGSLRGVVLRQVRGPTRPSRHIYAAVRSGAERSPILAPVLSALQVSAVERIRPAARPRTHHSAR